MQILNARQGDISAALVDVGSLPLARVIDHYTENIDNDSYPCLMVQEIGEDTLWYGIPQMAYWNWSFNVYGLIQHDDPAEMAKIKRRFAAVVKDVLCRGHQDKQFGDHYIQFLDGALPVKSMRYDVQMVTGNNVIVKGFVASWSCQAVQPVWPI